jgi:uncharacterized membrane protein YozB (DUF420 family)
MTVPLLPTVNACLNATSAVLLVVGLVAIKRGQIALHKRCMLSALAVSALFLASYLYFHLVMREGKVTTFPSDPLWARGTYLFILLTHTLLAMGVAVLAPVTAWLGLSGRLAWHKRMAQWTFPIWLYVSITGVIVYLMLYHLFPPPDVPS